MKDRKPRYVMHTMNGCIYCNQAKALFNHYSASYDVVYEKCDEWDTFPAIYKITEDGNKELIGGFDQLARYSYEHGL